MKTCKHFLEVVKISLTDIKKKKNYVAISKWTIVMSRLNAVHFNDFFFYHLLKVTIIIIRAYLLAPYSIGWEGTR